MFKKLMKLLFNQNNVIKHVTTEKLKGLLKDQKNYFFIDVRTKGEFKQKSIRNFINFPLQTLEQNMTKIPKDKEIVVICQSGGRSAMACRLLKKHGYEKIINVKGGMNAWRN